MTNVEGSTSIVCFHDRPSIADELPPGPEPAEESLDYLQGREWAERAAAISARSAKARQVHEELAQFYARKIGGRRSGP